MFDEGLNKNPFYLTTTQLCFCCFFTSRTNLAHSCVLPVDWLNLSRYFWFHIRKPGPGPRAAGSGTSPAPCQEASVKFRLARRDLSCISIQLLIQRGRFAPVLYRSVVSECAGTWTTANVLTRAQDFFASTPSHLKQDHVYDTSWVS